MNAYDRAVKLFEAEHNIVDIVYNYIDRMNDPTDTDTLEKIAGEFVKAVNPAIEHHLKKVRSVGT